METDEKPYFANMFQFKPSHPNMMYYICREQSFTNWPPQLVQKPEELIQNGFFYTDIGDRVTCFYCGVTLKQWNKDDKVDTEHLKWEPNCLFAKMVSPKVPRFDVFRN